ncbi:molybdate ABC transporter substrate-binding protein [Candidatus Entotheonella palauensis]|uniref:molybdate ABC transporter substrate-binding protein n=1 Tax=Candidatus Entotheonella palauensis TaxID=93172 RepID=UPI0015C4BBC8|nr:molybdate ABC transporter substrate-binding protein [Candidatus Entotheonella palauensis]
MRRWQCYILIWGTLLILAATNRQTTNPLPIAGTLTVFAAASLTEPFTAVGKRLEQIYPGLRIRFNFAGSQTLRTQLEQGAPADVFASANMPQMRLAKQSGVVHHEAPIFIKNRLTLMVPHANPGQVTGLQDLANPGIKLVLAGQHVPVGRYSRQVLSRASAEYGEDFETRVLQNLISEEHNVKQVVTKIQLGEADAGIAYVSDLSPQIGNAIRSIPIPDAYNIEAAYPIAMVKDTRQLAAAEVFIDFVHSEQGQAIMKSYHFIPVLE